MPRRQTRILGQARVALKEHWQAVKAGEQVVIRMEEDQEVGASRGLVALSGTEDVL